MNSERSLVQNGALGFAIIAMLLATCGCTPSPAQRLAKSIRSYERTVSAPGSGIQMEMDAILEGMRKSSVQSLQSPLLVWAAVEHRPDRRLVMVSWIAAAPDIDGIEIARIDGVIQFLPIPELHSAKNRKSARYYVVFDAEWIAWPGEPFFELCSSSNLTARLRYKGALLPPIQVRMLASSLFTGSRDP